MRLSELLDNLEVPATRVADGAWDTGVRRVRRRRAGVVATAAVLTAGVIVAAATAGNPGRGSAPSPAVPPTSPTPTPSATVTRATTMPPVFTDKAWEHIVDAASRIQLSPANTVDLSQRPLDRAVLAVGDPTNETAVLVLGVDGLWRRVDGVDLVRVHDGVGYESPSLQATSLSPDATKLALPQPGSLVVVDLTTGDSTRYDAGGQTNQWVTWADDTHVLLNNEEDATGVLVDLATGTTLPSSFGPSTAFLPDGSAVTWQGLWFERGDGTLVPTDVTNSARLNPSPPLANADVLVGLDGYAYGRGESPTYRVAVVDGVTGDSLAFQPLGTGGGVADQLLGWDGDRIVLALVNQNISASYTAVVAWDWKQQKLDPLVVLPGWAVSWGQGWADGVAAN